MKIGVISDTHLSDPNECLYRLADHVFADADVILHAGDLISLEILKVFFNKKVISVGILTVSDTIEGTIISL
jgi:predicted phosphodiesterase